MRECDLWKMMIVLPDNDTCLGLSSHSPAGKQVPSVSLREPPSSGEVSKGIIHA